MSLPMHVHVQPLLCDTSELFKVTGYPFKNFVDVRNINHYA